MRKLRQVELDDMARRLNAEGKFRDVSWLGEQVVKKRMSEKTFEAINNSLLAASVVLPDERFDVQLQLRAEYHRHYVYPQIYINLYTYCEFDHSMMKTVIDHFRGDEERCERYYFNNLKDFYREPNRDTYSIRETVTFSWVKPCVVIHYPEITVKNSRGNSIDIRDLFVKLSFNDRGKLEAVSGMRTTYTVDEFKAGYMHSHLSAFNPTDDEFIKDFRSFCLGEGPIKDATLLYNADRDYNDLAMVFLHTETLVSWESLEGGPHIRMERVKFQDEVKRENYDEDSLANFWDIFRSHADWYSNPDWTFKDGRYRIVDNANFEKYVASVRELPKVLISPTGQLYAIHKLTQTRLDALNTSGRYVLFQGREYRLLITGELNIIGDTQQYVHPQVKDYVRKQLEHTAYEAQINDHFTQLNH